VSEIPPGFEWMVKDNPKISPTIADVLYELQVRLGDLEDDLENAARRLDTSRKQIQWVQETFFRMRP
jgi:hypothetical protein